MSSTKLRNICGTSVAALILNVLAAHASVQISAAPTMNMNCSAGVCTATAQKAVLNVTDLANMLASGDVAVKSSSVAPDVDVDAALSWTSTSRLTLDSYHSITFNKPLVVAGSGAVTITTDDGGADGDYRFFGKGHVEFWDLSSSLVINGNSYGLYKNIKKLAAAARRQAEFYALASPYNAAKDGTYTRTPISFNTGAFDGLGNTISNLTINDSTHGESVALFGTNSNIGTIRDLGLLNAAMTGNGTSGVGTLVGQNSGTVTNCYATGLASATISSVGGLVAANLNIVSRSYAAVAVTAGPSSEAGGLVADNGGVIQQSYATGSVSAGDNGSVGGLAGTQRDAIVTDSYATGAVTEGASAAVGGLVGANIHTKTIQNTYSTGAVSGGTEATVGGLIGADVTGGSISDSYWDTDTSGINNPHQGAGNISNDPGITGLTDAQLKSGLPTGFDPNIWAQKASINNGYPYLIANPPQ